MQVMCSWCEKFLKEKEPLLDRTISHGICKECYKKTTDQFYKELGKNRSGNTESTSSSRKERDMMNKPREIAKREWVNIGHSLEMCGDIGEFDLEDFILDKPTFISNLSRFAANLVEMDEKATRHGYATPEALDAFTTLAAKALERLGLSKEWALAFGDGYGYVRTGWLGLHEGTEDQQVLFSRMFFPTGKVSDWDFDSSSVKINFKTVLETFIGWQNDPQLYANELRRYYKYSKSSRTKYDSDERDRT
jgi:hypothetical protein